jgi:hypothetical protein
MRKRESRNTAGRLLTVSLLLLTPALEAWMQLPRPNSTRTVEVSAGGMFPLGGSTLVGKGTTPSLDVEFSDMPIAEADVGYQAADFLFLRMGLAAGSLDFSAKNFGSSTTGFESVRIGAADFQMLKAAALFHFSSPPEPGSLLSQRLWHDVEMRIGIGPVVAFSHFSDVTISQEGRDKLGVTAITGRGDPSFGMELIWLFMIRDSGWMVSLDAGAMLTKSGSVRVETGPTSNYEPATLTYRPLYGMFGVGYRF